MSTFKRIVSCLVLLSFNICLSNCSPKCQHVGTLYTLEEKIYCENAGQGIYVCSKCGEKIIYSIPPAGHNWEEKSLTTTCEEDGIRTFECSRCQKTKEEPVSAFGHRYDIDDTCIRCKKYKFNFVFQDNLPHAVYYLKNSGGYYAAADILELSVHTDWLFSSKNAEIYFKGKLKKTYDIDGENGTTRLKFKIKIVEKSGEVIGISDVSFTQLAVGQTHSFDYSSGFKTSIFDEKAEYVVSLLNY